MPDFVRQAEQLSNPHLWLTKSPSELTPGERKNALRIACMGASITIATEEMLQDLPAAAQLPPSKYALVNTHALPPEHNTSNRKMHDRIHYIILWNHEALVGHQYEINERLREAGEWDTFDIIPFLNALEQHFEGKDRFLMMPRFNTPNAKQMEWLTALRQRKPVLHVRLIGYLLQARLYQRSPHLADCTCCLCAHIIALRPLPPATYAAARAALPAAIANSSSA